MPKFIKIFACSPLQAFLNLTIPSTTYQHKYMNMCHSSSPFRTFNDKFCNYIFIIRAIFTHVINFYSTGRKFLSFSLIWPILLGLMSSFWIIKRTEHYYDRYVLIIDSLPKIIVLFNGGLTKDSKYLTINERFDFICIYVIFWYLIY